MSYQLTKEQQEILDKVESLQPNETLMVDAKAGTGKSSTSKALTKLYPNSKIMYTAFNKAIVDEGKETFPSYVECRTMHALALSYVKPKKKIEDLTYTCLQSHLDSYEDRLIVIKAIDQFYRSASLDMYEYMEAYMDKLFSYNKEKAEELSSVACEFIEGMIEGKYNPTFNYLLKHFHLLLHEGTINIQYDIVMLDECQDSTAVALEIFKLLPASKRIALGDQDQSIYHFMNLVNGFDLITENRINANLTKSFRCSEDIAVRVKTFGRKFLHQDFTFIGTSEPLKDGKVMYITRTNAQIIERLVDLLDNHQTCILTRPVTEIFAAPLALVTAASGKKPYQKKYFFLQQEYKNFKRSSYRTFYEYLNEEVKDPEIESAIKLLMRFKTKNIDIFDIMAKAKKMRPDPFITVGTAFSLKGLGAETVYIEDDLNSAVADVRENGIESEEDRVTLRLYYVACTRARINLINALELR